MPLIFTGLLSLEIPQKMFVLLADLAETAVWYGRDGLKIPA
jgi:hypothetical protein